MRADNIRPYGFIYIFISEFFDFNSCYVGKFLTKEIFSELCKAFDLIGDEELHSADFSPAGKHIFFFKKSLCAEGGFLSAASLSGKDCMQIGVYGNDERMILVARYDNLGKGASGSAVECLNIVLGCDKTKTLVL